MATSTTEMFKSLAVKGKRAEQLRDNKSTVAKSDDESVTSESKPVDADADSIVQMLQCF